jgi:hypothetical protein
MFLIDDTPLTVGAGFTHNGISFPPNWATVFTAEDRAQYNIIEVPDPEPFDERFYWAPNNPKDITQIREMLITQVKQHTANILGQTSWMVERFNDPSSGKPVPQNVLDYRAATRALSNTYEEQINAATSVDDLAVMNLQFPELS